MSSTGRHIDRYPNLAAWYDAHLGRLPSPKNSAVLTNVTGSGTSPSTQLLMAICVALPGEKREHILQLISGINSFVRDSSDHLNDFLEADQVLAADNLTLTGVISAITEHAISFGLGPVIQECIAGLANSTPLAALRFLTGWIALNLNDYGRCIEECEKISEPFAAVYALMGQASLEMGDLSDAIESLTIATTLDSNEPMSWFQLAKAYHVGGEFEKSWKALNRVEDLIGPDVEVSSMRAFVALAEGSNLSHLEKAWTSLLDVGGQQKSPPGLATLLLELSLARSDYENTLKVIHNLDAKGAARDKDFIANLPHVLRRLGEHGRMDLVTVLLDRIIPEDAD